ncbi:hypothetical protein ACFWBG_22120 [Nocardia salmonicida]|uniref:hypothetical protein n=1 Tax=Nocardia salmonicida TaxID=53431 RepID=UPI00366A9FA5
MSVSSANSGRSYAALFRKNGLNGSDLRKLSSPELHAALDLVSNFPDGWVAPDGTPLSESSAFEVLKNDIPPRLDNINFFIRDLLAALEAKEQVAELQGAVKAKVQDPELRADLADLIADFAREQQQAALEAKSTEAAEKMRQAVHDAEIKERNWQRWKLMLDREPVAVLVGAVLLGVLTLALVVAMFVHTDVPEILSSGFLLILGFFFGQASGGGRVE